MFEYNDKLCVQFICYFVVLAFFAATDNRLSRALKIAECQKEILEAKAMVEEAERALSQDGDQLGDGYGFSESGNGEIDKDKERWQSIKAASISALVGTVAGLPFSFTQVSSSSELILPLAITFVSCALFGVTFRYAVRRDLDDVHLKTGAPAAFGVVKGTNYTTMQNN